MQSIGLNMKEKKNQRKKEMKKWWLRILLCLLFTRLANIKNSDKKQYLNHLLILNYFFSSEQI